MFGLARGSAGQASLLLNLEGVLTALLAWWVFREHVPTRIAVGMGLIAFGAFAVTWQPGHGLEATRSAVLIGGAGVAWAVDNNLTRKVSGGDPIPIAAIKGGAAGAANLAIALARGTGWPDGVSATVAAVIGFFGYGVSLALFVRALRSLGAARTGAYFSSAPFVGAMASFVALGEPLTVRLAAGAVLMGVGVWLHVSERHEHEHVHDRVQHEHLHRHDEHHDHEHEPGTPSGEPHSHRHTHVELRHVHRHYPDLHHRHGH
jgi:drug/metabolite transporter (DMT)-like permease